MIGRGIENAILSYICEDAKNKGVKKIKARFVPSKKNKPAETFLPDFGFKKENDYWIYYLNNTIKSPNHLMLKIE